MAVIGRPSPPSKLNASDIASNAITSAHIQSDALTHADLAPNSVTNSEMADDAVGIAELSASGTPNATSFLRGDNSWQVVDTEGTGIKSTGESGGNKFLREDGDGTSSWQVAGSPSITDNGNATALTIDSDEALTVNGSFKQLTNRNLSGTYSSHELFIADGYTLTGNITVNEDIALTKLSDDGASITLTTDGNSRTITGTGSIEASTLAQTPVTSVTGMTGTLGSGVTLDSPTGTLANSVTGSPALNLANATYRPGSVIQTISSRPSNYSSTLSYSSASLVPCASQAITAVGVNSSFIITWSAEHARSAAGRSQWAITDTYTAGQSSYPNDYFFYSHYGWYHASGGGNFMTSVTYHDKSQSLAAGASVTYYIFLGAIGSATDQASHQSIQVQEIAG